MPSQIAPTPPEPFEPTERASLTRKQKLEVMLRQNGRCAKCLNRFALADLEFDHIKPIGLGGSNDLTNIEALCVEDHKAKTRLDVRMMRKADRQKRAHEGTKPQNGPKLKGRGFGRDHLHWRNDP